MPPAAGAEGAVTNGAGRAGGGEGLVGMGGEGTIGVGWALSRTFPSPFRVLFRVLFRVTPAGRQAWWGHGTRAAAETLAACAEELQKRLQFV